MIHIHIYMAKRVQSYYKMKMLKYVPPHKRSQQHEDNSYTRKYNHPRSRQDCRYRRDLSLAPQFNVKSDPTSPISSIKSIDDIGIVDVIPPVMVTLPSPDQESPYKEAIRAGLEVTEISDMISDHHEQQ